MSSSPSGARLTAGWAGIAATTAGFIAAIVGAAEGMRELMVTSGGFCASGGPYVIAQECDESAFALLFVGIVVALLLAAARALANAWVKGPRVGTFSPLAVIFAVFGWNFLDLGLDPPPDQGSGGVWIACGVLFWLMAIGFSVPTVWRIVDWFRRDGEPEPSVLAPPLVRAAVPGRTPDPPVAEPVPLGMSRGLTLAFVLATVVGIAVGIPLGLAIADAVL